MSNCDSCSNKESSNLNNIQDNKIKNIIAVMSGKGGVGKSTMSVMIARQLVQRGYRVGVLDADITGPSIPRLLNIEEERAVGTENLIFPVESSEGIKVMSLNLVVENEDEAVIWRGPAIVNVVKQFWTGVYWGELDYLIIDMPPGTGDVPLTVFQSLPLDGIIIVTSPQELVGMIVSKAVNMAKKMDVDIIGIVENMSYVKCPDCDKKIYMFGKSHSQEVADRYQLPLLGQLPIDSELTQLSDQGYVENYHSDWFDEFSQKVKDI